MRGRGLFLGVELVRDRVSLAPATEEASYVCNRMRDAGILVGTEGPAHNTLKVRPPLCFSIRDADFFADTLDGILKEDGLQPTAAAAPSAGARDGGRGGGAFLLVAAAAAAAAVILSKFNK